MAPRKKPSPLQGHKERLKGEQVHTNRKRPRGHRAHPWEISGKYAVTRITSRYDSENDHLSNRGKYLSHIDFKIPGEPTDAEPNLVTVVSEKAPISIEDLEGHTIGGQWRIIRALEPVKGAPHGGFILERLEQL